MGKGNGRVHNGGGGSAAPTWPSAANRPVWDSGTSTLSWTGPSGGGASGTLVAQSRVLTNLASINSSSINQVIEGRNITGAVRIRHSGVILRQCRIAAAEAFIIAVDSGNPANVVIEDCLIDGTGVAGTTAWLPESSAGGSIIRRCNITGVENGIAIGENNMFIQDNWIHDLFTSEAAHTDGIQGTGGFTILTITGNAIYGDDTSCIIMQNEGAGFSGLSVDGNLLVMNSGSACIVCRGDKAAGIVGAVSFTNNYLGKSASGSYNDFNTVGGPLTYTGNVDYLTGVAVTSGE
jgi:hypothetical protein